VSSACAGRTTGIRHIANNTVVTRPRPPALRVPPGSGEAADAKDSESESFGSVVKVEWGLLGAIAVGMVVFAVRRMSRLR
jgi:hypothetical protein